MAFKSEAVARAFAVRIHTGECECEGDLASCVAFQTAMKRPGAPAQNVPTDVPTNGQQ